MDGEKLKMNSRRLLRDGGESSRNTFTVGNGNRPGVTPERGRYWETGTSRGNPGPAGGAWRQVYRATGEPSATQPGKAPSISYMEGALLFPPATGILPARAPGANMAACAKTGMRARMGPQPDQSARMAIPG